MTNDSKVVLSQFLEKTLSQKDVSLVVARDSKEIKAFEAVLVGEGFKMVNHISEILSALNNPSKSVKLYISPDHGNVKALYDFLIQYPTGQVEIFNDKQMQSEILHPEYTNSAIVLLILKDELKRLELSNFAFAQYAGLAFQS